MRPASERTLAVGTVVLGSVVTFTAAGQVRVSGGGVTDVTTPAATALAVVGLAGAGAVLLVRPVARRLVAVVVLAAGVGIVLSALAVPHTGASTVGFGARTAPQRTGWAWLLVASGALTGLGAVTMLARAGRWPVSGRSYTRSPARPSGADDEARAAADARRAWDALDRGEDPTT
jgi:hypothetical protein